MYFGRHMWEQKKLEARKMLENATDSCQSGALFALLAHVKDVLYGVAISICSA
jgi:hypothetical protein